MAETDTGRDEAISDILAMSPPTLGGHGQAVLNLQTLSTGRLLDMRHRLRAALERLPTGRPPPPETAAASRAARAGAGRKLGSGLAKLRAASEAIRTSRQGPGEAEG